MLRSIVGAIEAITRWAGWLGAAITVPLVLAMVYEVVARYAFNAPTFWAYELAYMMMGTGLMLGIAYTMQARAHVRVDFFYQTRSLRGRALIDLIGCVVLLPMILWLSVGLWDYFLRAYVQNEVSGESAWNPVVWPFRFFFIVGIVLFALQTISEILKSASIIMTGEAYETEPDIEAGER